MTENIAYLKKIIIARSMSSVNTALKIVVKVIIYSSNTVIRNT